MNQKNRKNNLSNQPKKIHVEQYTKYKSSSLQLQFFLYLGVENRITIEILDNFRFLNGGDQSQNMI